MKNSILFLGAFLAVTAVFPADGGFFSAVVVTPKNKPEQAQEIASGLSKAFKDQGHQLKLRTYTEECNPEKDKALISKIMDNQPHFVIGYSCKESAQIAEDELKLSDTPLFLLGGDVPKALTHQTLLKMMPEPETLFDGFVEALKRFKNKQFLVLDDKTGQADELIQTLRETFPAQDLKVLDVPPHQLNQNLKKLSKAIDSKYDFIVVSSLDPSQAVRVVSRIREAGLKLPILGLDVLGQPEFSAMIGNMKEGIYFYAPECGRFSLDAAPIIADLRFDEKIVGDATVSAYASAQIFMKALKDRSFYNKKFKTVLGSLEFDESGTLKSGFPGHFFKWENNSVEPDFQLVEK